ncbi:MAG: hypothetical protein ACREKF_09035, partial [Candidatus Methylomirabilales bacterium]
LSDAEKVIAVQVRGGKNGERELVTVPDHSIRLEACRDYLRVLGPLGKVAGDALQEGEMGNRVNITIIHAPPAASRQAPKTITIQVPKPDGKGR